MRNKHFLTIGLIIFLVSPVGFSARNTCSTLQDVTRAQQAWAAAIASHNPQRVNALYASHAILHGTFATTIANTREASIQYFKHLFHNSPNLTVTFQKPDLETQLFKNFADSSGFYTFNTTKNDKPVAIPARFTFVYIPSAQGCKIVTHHSSVLPAPAK